MHVIISSYRTGPHPNLVISAYSKHEHILADGMEDKTWCDISRITSTPETQQEIILEMDKLMMTLPEQVIGPNICKDFPLTTLYIVPKPDSLISLLPGMF